MRRTSPHQQQMSDNLSNAGTIAQGKMAEFIGVSQAIASNPALRLNSCRARVQTVMGALQQTTSAPALNQLGRD